MTRHITRADKSPEVCVSSVTFMLCRLPFALARALFTPGYPHYPVSLVTSHSAPFTHALSLGGLL